MMREKMEKKLCFAQDVRLNYQAKSPHSDPEGNYKVHLCWRTLVKRHRKQQRESIDGMC